AAVLPEALRKQDGEVFAAHQAVIEALSKIARVETATVPAPEIPSDGIALLTVNVEEAGAFEELIESGELSTLRSTDAIAAARAGVVRGAVVRDGDGAGRGHTLGCAETATRKAVNISCAVRHPYPPCPCGGTVLCAWSRRSRRRPGRDST